MIRLSVLAWITLAFGLVVGLFHIKAQVEGFHRSLAQVNRQIEDERERIRVLNTEWSHLDHPERIAQLATTHLGYEVSYRPSITSVEALPQRTVSRAEVTSVLAIQVADEPMSRLGPLADAEVLEVEGEIGSLRHIASPDTLGDLIQHLGAQ